MVDELQQPGKEIVEFNCRVVVTATIRNHCLLGWFTKVKRHRASQHVDSAFLVLLAARIAKRSCRGFTRSSNHPSSSYEI
jgi:hypothetical protein